MRNRQVVNIEEGKDMKNQKIRKGRKIVSNKYFKDIEKRIVPKLTIARV